VFTTLHLDTGREMRGGQWQALYLLRGLAEAGHRACLLAPSGSPLLRAAQSAGLDAHALTWPALARALRSPDLVHAHDARAHSFGLLGPKPLVAARRVAFAPKRGVASRWKYARASRYIAVSNFVRQTLISAGVDAARVSVVYDGVPLAAGVVGAERALVVALDSADPGKGRRIVSEAAALAKIPVHFSNDLARDLGRAALFVYISDSEGLGSAALLAMAAGAPVVASRVGGLPEVVEHGVSGLLTENDPRAVADAMARLLTDRSLAERLAACARERAAREFTVERMIAGTLEAYERTLA